MTEVAATRLRLAEVWTAGEASSRLEVSRAQMKVQESRRVVAALCLLGGVVYVRSPRVLYRCKRQRFPKGVLRDLP